MRCPFSRLPALLLLGVLPLATGCVPVVTWLPDSSGFVYTEDKDETHVKLLLYDLKAKKTTELGTAEGKTLLPAVSPDGKTIATARVVLSRKGPHKVRVALHDRAGKLVKQSDWAEFGRGKPMQDEDERDDDSLLHWSPDGTRVLVTMGEEPGAGPTAVYEPAKNAVTLLPGVTPMLHATPIRPDGKGFLGHARDGKDGPPVPALVAWDGKVTKLDHLPGSEPDVFEFRWAGGKGLWREAGRLATIDPATGAVTVKQDVFDVKRAAKDKGVQAYTFGDGTTRLCVITWDEPVRGVGGTATLHRIEVQTPGKEPKVVVKRESKAVSLASVSPDGNLVALSSGAGILVIDAKGEVVAEVARKE